MAATKDGPLELLIDVPSLYQWLVEAQVASLEQVDLLRRQWSKASGEGFLSAVKSYRSQIKEVVDELGNRQQVPEGFIRETNRLLREAQAVLQVKTEGSKVFSRTWPLDWTKPESVLGLIAETGLKLVCDCDLSLIRKCENPQCVLVFYDTTKNHQRRWCSMEACGNRHKAALHRRKHGGTKQA